MALLVKIGADISDLVDKLSRGGGSVQTFGSKLELLGSKWIQATTPIKDFGASVLSVAGDFEQGMNRVKVLTQSNEVEFKQLSDLAQKLGADTMYSSKQAADSMGNLAQAGFKTKEIISLLPQVLQLAAAGQIDLASSASITSNIVRGFGISAEGVGHSVDVMAKVITSSNTDLTSLADGMKMVAPVSRNAGLSFEETSAALAILNNAGIQGSMAGRELRGIIASLISPSNDGRDALAELGITVLDASGKMLPLKQIVDQLAKSNMSTAQSFTIFGRESAPAINALVTTGSQGLIKFTDELHKAGGTAEHVGSVQMSGYKGAIESLSGSYEGLKIAIASSGLLEFSTNLAKDLTDITNAVAASNPELLKWGTVIGAVAVAGGPLILFAGKSIEAFRMLGAVLSPLSPALLVVGAGFAGWELGVLIADITGLNDGLHGTVSVASELIDKNAQLISQNRIKADSDHAIAATAKLIELGDRQNIITKDQLLLKYSALISEMNKTGAAGDKAFNEFAKLYQQELNNIKATQQHNIVVSAQSQVYTELSNILNSTMGSYKSVQGSLMSVGNAIISIVSRTSQEELYAANKRTQYLKEDLKQWGDFYSGVRELSGSYQSDLDMMGSALYQLTETENADLSQAKLYVQDFASSWGLSHEQAVSAANSALQNYSENLNRVLEQDKEAWSSFNRSVMENSQDYKDYVDEMGSVLYDYTEGTHKDYQAAQAYIDDFAQYWGISISDAVGIANQSLSQYSSDISNTFEYDTPSSLDIATESFNSFSNNSIDYMTSVEDKSNEMVKTVSSNFAAMSAQFQANSSFSNLSGSVAYVGVGPATLSDQFQYTQKMIYQMLAGAGIAVDDQVKDWVKGEQDDHGPNWTPSQDMIKALQDALKNGSSLPHFAKGGIVSSPTLGVFGERGPEAIIPLDRLGSGGSTTVNVYISGSVVSENDLVMSIKSALLGNRRLSLSGGLA